MCWSAEISAATALFESIVLFHIWHRNHSLDRAYVAMYGCITMQEWAQAVVWWLEIPQSTDCTIPGAFFSAGLLMYVEMLPPAVMLVALQLLYEHQHGATFLRGNLLSWPPMIESSTTTATPAGRLGGSAGVNVLQQTVMKTVVNGVTNSTQLFLVASGKWNAVADSIPNRCMYSLATINAFLGCCLPPFLCGQRRSGDKHHSVDEGQNQGEIEQGEGEAEGDGEGKEEEEQFLHSDVNVSNLHTRHTASHSTAAGGESTSTTTSTTVFSSGGELYMRALRVGWCRRLFFAFWMYVLHVLLLCISVLSERYFCIGIGPNHHQIWISSKNWFELGGYSFYLANIVMYKLSFLLGLQLIIDIPFSEWAILTALSVVNFIVSYSVYIWTLEACSIWCWSAAVGCVYLFLRPYLTLYLERSRQ